MFDLLDFILKVNTSKYKHMFYKDGKIVLVGDDAKTERKLDLGNVLFYVDNLKGLKDFIRRFIRNHGKPDNFYVMTDELDGWVLVAFCLEIETSTSCVSHDYVILGKKEDFEKLMEMQNV